LGAAVAFVECERFIQHQKQSIINKLLLLRVLGPINPECADTPDLVKQRTTLLINVLRGGGFVALIKPSAVVNNINNNYLMK